MPAIKRSYIYRAIRSAFAMGLAAAAVAACTARPAVINPAGEAASPPFSSFFPADDEVPGWRADEEVFVARDLAELTSRIDGGAPYYFDRGVREAAFRTYAAGAGEILEIEVYRTGRDEQALILYEERSPSATVPLDLPAGEGWIEEGGFGSYSATLHVGRHFALLWVTVKDEPARTALVDFASRLALAAAEWSDS